MRSDKISVSDARRLALAAQGFDRPRPCGQVDVREFKRAIRQIGRLQIDCVNLLVPAHHHVPFSRLGPHAHGQKNRAKISSARSSTDRRPVWRASARAVCKSDSASTW